MNTARWRAALRIARREAWRSKGRSLLVIALIGLPIFALGGADIAYRTWQLSPTEKLARAIGMADAGIQWAGSPVQQAPSGYLKSEWTTVGSANAPRPTTAQLRAQLPAGSRLISDDESTVGAQVRTPAGLEYANVIGLDYADPLARGIVNPVHGHAPRSADQAAVTTRLAAKADLRLGGTMRLADLDPTAGSERTFTVVGIVDDAGSRHAEAVYVRPSVLPPPPSAAQGYVPPEASGWLVDSPRPITWQQVLKLNTLGYIVTSRQAYLHPPPPSEIEYRASGGSISRQALSAATLIVGMALLEVVLLAGPAFAVGARRQRRQLALVASAGGRSADLRNVVLSNAIVLGAAAGVIGIALAVVGMAIGIPTLGTLADQVPGHFDVRPAELALLVLVAVLTALAAAAFPARAAARTDVVAALAGRRGTLRTRKRVVAIGLVVGAIGAVIAIGGATHSSNGATVILFGVALVELGLIACTPALIGWVGRLGRQFPLAPRIALRDASRNRSAAAPAVAAVMASVIGAMAAILVVASTTDQDRRDYQASLPMNAAWVDLDSGNRLDGNEVDTRSVVAAVRAALPVADSVVVRGPSQSCPLTKPNCTIGEIDFTNPRWMIRNGGSRALAGYLPNTIVDDGSGVTALFGKPEPAAAAALRAGKVVVVDAAAAGKDGAVRLTGSHGAADTVGTTAAKATQLTVPAVVVPDGYPAAQLIVPPTVAAKLGVAVKDLGVFARDTRAPSDREKQQLAGRLNAIEPELYDYIESGYHDDRAWMMYALVGVAAVIAIGAAVIATALADVDGRADLVTLGAVGAAPRTRRVLSLSRAGVVAGVGAVLGTAAGFIPAIAYVRATRLPASAIARVAGVYTAQKPPAQLYLVVPWLPTAAILIGIPLLAALLAGAFSRSRLPSERPSE
jgi:putative ABC transport system permease protein